MSDAGLVRAILRCRDGLKRSGDNAVAALGWSLAELVLIGWLERRWRSSAPAQIVMRCGARRVSIDFGVNGAVFRVVPPAGDAA